jgi:hypothetical protein
MTDLREIKRAMNLARIPSATTIIDLVGAVLLLEEKNEWAVTRSLQSMVGRCDDPSVGQMDHAFPGTPPTGPQSTHAATSWW